MVILSPTAGVVICKPTGQVGGEKTIWIFINKAFAVPGYDAERKSMFFHQMWFYLARINSYDRILVLNLLIVFSSFDILGKIT